MRVAVCTFLATGLLAAALVALAIYGLRSAE